MKVSTSRQAADEVGVNVQRWHRLVKRYQLNPTHEIPGIRGAKFWRDQDVKFIARIVEAERSEVAS